MKLRATFCIFLVLLSYPAVAKPIIADSSEYQIRIDSTFIGKSLLLFGARNETGDIVIVVRGPNRTFTVRKKERIAGMWMNNDYAILNQVPDFYRTVASRPLDQIVDQTLFPMFEIGEKNIKMNLAKTSDSSMKNEFEKAIAEYQKDNNLFPKQWETTTFMGETLFKTLIDFPDNIPRGTYTAEVYLMSDGILSGMQVIPIEVIKTGFDAFVYDAAHKSPALYGFFAILMALSIGWLGGLLFRKS
jgi:uncharacterized protein (TIGR02186 family)